MYILGIILNPKTHQVHEEGFSFKNSHKMDVFLGIILDRKTPSHSLISRGWELDILGHSRDEKIIPPLPNIANLSTKYFILCKVYTDKGCIK